MISGHCIEQLFWRSERIFEDFELPYFFLKNIFSNFLVRFFLILFSKNGQEWRVKNFLFTHGKLVKSLSWLWWSYTVEINRDLFLGIYNISIFLCFFCPLLYSFLMIQKNITLENCSTLWPRRLLRSNETSCKLTSNKMKCSWSVSYDEVFSFEARRTKMARVNEVPVTIFTKLWI